MFDQAWQTQIYWVCGIFSPSSQTVLAADIQSSFYRSGVHSLRVWVVLLPAHPLSYASQPLVSMPTGKILSWSILGLLMSTNKK